jgi:hypothetical protein
MHQQPALKDEILRGVKAIAEFIGETPRRVFYLAETGQIPVFKEGTTWVALKATLIAHYQKGAEEAAKRREVHLANSEANKHSAPGLSRKKRKAINAVERRQAAASVSRPA